jgi:hypothetical protein
VPQMPSHSGSALKEYDDGDTRHRVRSANLPDLGPESSARNAFRTLSAVPGNAGAVRYVADEYAPEVYGDAEVVP